MRNRKSFDLEFSELDTATDLVIHTKAPKKWILIDTETGEIYKGTSNSQIGRQWEKINTLKDIKKFKNSILGKK